MTDERIKFIARVFLGISLSILLHVVVSVLTYEAADFFREERPRQAMVLDLIEPTEFPKDDEKNVASQIVRKADLPPEALDLNLKAKRRFLSEDKQTVKQETRARASGMTENRTESLDLSPSREASRPVEQASRSKEKNEETRDAKDSKEERDLFAKGEAARKTASTSRERLPEIVPNSIFEEGIGDVEVKRELQTGSEAGGRRKQASRELLLPSDPRRNRGISTTGEQLPQDIQIGDFTALNTDRFVFYTFYARIEEQIRHRWVRYVKAAIFGGGDIPVGSRDFKTNLEIVLNREGDYVRAIIHSRSGSRDIDAAPVLAFREAKRIPHPPREMVKDDGTIRLFYSFHVDQLPPMARAANGKTRAAE